MNALQTPPAMDFFAVDELLSDEERLVRDTVRGFVRARVLPIIAEHFENGTFPHELVPEMARLGITGMRLQNAGTPQRVGHRIWPGVRGAGGRGQRTALAALRAGIAGDVSHLRVRFGRAEVTVVAAISEGRALGCFGLTEPDAGSNPDAMRTSARRDGATG